MTAPAVRPEPRALPVTAAGYVGIVNIDPPAGYVVPSRTDAEVQALLARAAERRAPDVPLRVVPTATGFVLADMDSYRRWWALRNTGSGIGQVKAEWVVVVEDADSPTPAVAPPAPKSSSATRIALDAITVDLGLQTRAAMNDATVAEYAEALLAGERLPPVVVFHDGEGIWLADGFHRVAAARQAGVADIEAIAHDGGRREALLHAVGANARHGLRRTNADKRRCVELLLADAEWARWSDRVVAEKCGVDHKTVAAVRANLTGEIPQCSARMTADGRVMDTANIGRKPATVLAPPPPANDDTEVPGEADTTPVETAREPTALPVPTVPSSAPVAANDDAQASADPQRLARRLDDAAAQVVQLLAELNAIDARAADTWAVRFVATVTRGVA